MPEKAFDKQASENSTTSGINFSALANLNEWKTLFLGFFDVSKEFVFIISEKGSFIAVNHFGAAILDYSTSELLGKHISELIDQQYIALFHSSINQAIKQGNSSFEAALLTKYDKKRNFKFSVKTIKSDDKIIGLLGIGRNVTKLRRLEEELKELHPKLIELERLVELERSRANHQKMMLDELNKMKSEFISNISHEMRTPLASIVGFSETIASEGNMTPEMKAEFNLIILNEGKRLARMINDVLDLSRIESGQVPLNKTECNILTLTKRAIEEVTSKILEKNLSLSLELPEEEILVYADEERMIKSIAEILTNAVKFTPPNGRIKIMINNLFKEVELVIADTGMGIPEKDLPNIFQKFYRVNRSNDDIPGAGMGLVFVKQIVDLHKGLINIQSEPNKGTSVIVKLPKIYKDKFKQG